MSYITIKVSGSVRIGETSVDAFVVEGAINPQALTDSAVDYFGAITESLSEDIKQALYDVFKKRIVLGESDD